MLKWKYINDCDFFVDDSISNCEEALEKNNCKEIMMKTNRTKGYDNKNINKVNNWKEVYEYIEKNIRS